MVSTAILRSVSLFKGLAEHELQPVITRLGRGTFAKNVFIYHMGSPGRILYIIESGKVRSFLANHMGQEISIDVYGPGEVFGELTPLDNLPRNTGAVTLELTIVLTLRQEDLYWLLETYPQTARNLTHLLGSRLRHATTYAAKLAFLDVTGRVIAWLLDLAERYGVPGRLGTEIDLRLTQAELASAVASSRESVNKILCTLRAQGLLQVEDQQITLLDRRALEKMIWY
jgi:CRP/FNR family transcriptional regulator